MTHTYNIPVDYFVAAFLVSATFMFVLIGIGLIKDLFRKEK